MLLELKVAIEAVFFDDNFVYHDVISVNVLFTGKCNTWRIECKYLTFCTRFKCLACRAICCSKSLGMHKIVFGLLVNVLEFGCKLF
ncbi:MAG: IS1 family transposase [Nitrososphaerota archaeon]|nr:IS1 family transposase [Nitrososphaerota archaeon]